MVLMHGAAEGSRISRVLSYCSRSKRGARVWLVVYPDEDGNPYGCAFSQADDARDFAAEVDGEVIDTHVDDHVDLITREGRQ